MRNVIILFALLFAFLGCKKPHDDVRYLFPNRMKKIEAKEWELVCKNKYKISLFEDKHTSFKAHADSIFVFCANGEIRDSKHKIGRWKTDRTLFLEAYNKRFYFFNIGKNSDHIALKTLYRESKNDTLYKSVLIGMANVNYKPDPDMDNGDEFDM